MNNRTFEEIQRGEGTNTDNNLKKNRRCAERVIVALFLSFSPASNFGGEGGLSNGTPSPLRAIIPISPSARGALQSLSTRLNNARGAAAGKLCPARAGAYQGRLEPTPLSTPRWSRASLGGTGTLIPGQWVHPFHDRFLSSPLLSSSFLLFLSSCKLFCFAIIIRSQNLVEIRGNGIFLFSGSEDRI